MTSTEQENRVLEALKDGEQSVNELAFNAGIPASDVTSTIISLRDQGKVQSQTDQGTLLWRFA